MADQSFNDFLPPEMRKFAEQSVQQRFGGRDNQLIVVDTDGRIAFKQDQTDPAALDEFLHHHLPPRP